MSIKASNLCLLSLNDNVQLMINDRLMKESNKLSWWVEKILKHSSIAFLMWIVNFSNQIRSNRMSNSCKIFAFCVNDVSNVYWHSNIFFIRDLIRYTWIIYSWRSICRLLNHIERFMNNYYSLFWNFVLFVTYMQLKHKKCANVKTLISIDRFIQLNFDCNICRTHLRKLYF